MAMPLFNLFGMLELELEFCERKILLPGWRLELCEKKNTVALQLEAGA